jgi:hypothetical protein
MKVPLTDETHSQLENLIPDFQATVDELDALNVRSESVAKTRTESLALMGEAAAREEALTDKQILNLLVARERANLLDTVGHKISDRLQAQRIIVARLAHEASQLISYCAGKYLVKESRSSLAETLPAAIRNDEGLVIAIWGKSAELQSITRFLSSPAITPGMSTSEVIEECRGRIDTLTRLLHSDDIVIPGLLQPEDAAVDA